MDMMKATFNASAIVFLIAAMLSVPSLFHLPSAPFDGPASAQDVLDWVINGDVVIANETRTVNSSIIVESQGKLTISDATLLFNISENGGKGLLVKGGGTLLMERSDLASAERYFRPYVQITGRATIRDSTLHNLSGDWEGGGGVQILKGSDVIMTGNELYWMERDAITVSGSRPLISGNDIHDNTVGIRCWEGANATLTHNNIHGNSLQGIFTSESVTIAEDNDISGSQFGLMFLHDEGALTRNNVTSNGVGIDMDYLSTLTITGNHVSKSEEFGMRIFNSTPLVSDNVFEENKEGIRVTLSKAIIERNDIRSNVDGIRVLGGNNTIRYNNITKNSRYGLLLTSATVVEDGNYYGSGDNVNGKGRRAVEHQMDIFVKDDNGEPIQNASITVTDDKGEVVWEDMTDEGGRNPEMFIMEYYEDSAGTVHNVTPHNIRIYFEGMETDRDIDVVKDIIVTVVLRENRTVNNIWYVPYILTAMAILILFVGILLLWSHVSTKRKEREKEKRLARFNKKDKRGKKGRREQ